MTKRSKIIIGASLGLLVAVPGVALAVQQDGPGAPRTRAEVQAKTQERFTALDTNRDGAVTQAEIDASRAKRVQERDAKRAERRTAMFQRLDTDRNGQLSPAEFAARPARDADARDGEHRGRRGDRHGGRGGHHRGGPDGAGRDGGQGMLARMDANHDGRVTLAEMQAPALARFDRADANRDGTVTREEMRAARQAARGTTPPTGNPAN